MHFKYLSNAFTDLMKKKKKNINWKIAIKLIKDNYYLCLQISWEYVSPFNFPLFSWAMCGGWKKRKKRVQKWSIIDEK